MTWKRPKSVAEGWVPLRHGTPSSYNRGCRCEECGAAHRERMRAAGCTKADRQARFAERVEVDGRLVHPNPPGGHGTRETYNRCGCRCGPCRAAAADYRRDRAAQGLPA